jgi:hypothetical protein
MAEIFSLAGVYLANADEDPAFALGQQVEATSGAVYVYAQANGAIDVYDACILDEDGQAIVASVTTSAAAFGDRVGAAQATLANDEYGWFQVYGKGSVNVLASAAANKVLNTTGTDGQLDDDATVGAEVIGGLILGTAQPASAGANADAFFNWPTVGATL